MANDGIDRTDPANELRCDHFRTCAVLGLGGENESGVQRVTGVKNVVVVVHPGREPRTEAFYEGLGDPLETSA
jgi:hypothetical protein